MQHLNWDNLRYVLMVARMGSVAAAARELAVNRTTVLRRINSFQDDLNCRIFERGEQGYVMTAEAEKMLDAAQEVETTLFDMQRQIAGRELRLEGELRVTTTDTLMVSLIGPHLASFHRRHPHIVVDLVTTNNILDLSRRDADVAIRPTMTPDSSLVSRRISNIYFGVYASESYLSGSTAESLEQHQWIGFDAFLQSTPAGIWLDGMINKSSICMRGDSFVSLKVAAENGLGLVLLPHYLGEDSHILKRLEADTEKLTTGLWLLTHPDLIRSARVQAFIDHFTACLTEDP